MQTEYDKVGCKLVLGKGLSDFCTYWMGNGGLDCAGATADLFSMIVLFQEDMAEIEANHASIRRELMVLSTQTKVTDFIELSNRFVLRCCRRHPESYGVSHVPAVGAYQDKQPEIEEPDPKRPKLQKASALRHFIGEAARGDPRGCAQPGLTTRFEALPDAEKQRHSDGAATLNEARRLGARGFRPTNRMARAQRQRESAESSRIQMQQSVELDPTDTSASRALDAINLNSSMDFDEGVRALRRSLRSVFTVDGTTLAIQDKVLESHNSSNRDADGRIDGVPVGIADVLHEDDWKLMPHAVMSSIKHVRGSFPLAVEAMRF
jgi:hypothetical protein